MEQRARSSPGEGELPFKSVPAGKASSSTCAADGRRVRDDRLQRNAAAPLRRRRSCPSNRSSSRTCATPGRPARRPRRPSRFQCAGCGAPLTQAGEDDRGGGVRQLRRGHRRGEPRARDHLADRGERTRKFKPSIPLGSRGKIAGAEYEVIGYMCREMTGRRRGLRVERVPAAQPEQGYRWISEYNGHFSSDQDRRRHAAHRVRVGAAARSTSAATFKHFQTYDATRRPT